MSQKLDARIIRSQKALLKAGMELLNNNKAASFSDIANHAGVGRATLYRLFNSREKLIKAIAFYCHERFDEATESIDREATSAMDAIRLLFQLAMPLTQEFQFLAHLEYWSAEDSELLAMDQQQEAEMLALVDMAKKEGSICKSLPSYWVVNMIEALFYAGWKLQKDQQSTVEAAAEYAFRSLSQGVKPQR